MHTEGRLGFQAHRKLTFFSSSSRERAWFCCVQCQLSGHGIHLYRPIQHWSDLQCWWRAASGGLGAVPKGECRAEVNRASAKSPMWTPKRNTMLYVFIFSLSLSLCGWMRCTCLPDSDLHRFYINNGISGPNLDDLDVIVESSSASSPSLRADLPDIAFGNTFPEVG